MGAFTPFLLFKFLECCLVPGIVGSCAHMSVRLAPFESVVNMILSPEVSHEEWFLLNALNSLSANAFPERQLGDFSNLRAYFRQENYERN